MSPRTIAIATLLTISVVGSWYMARSTGPESEQETPLQAVSRGYYLKQARILSTGEDGSLLYEIRAAHAEQQQDRRIEFTDVRIRYSPQSKVPWTVRANSATLQAGNPMIRLNGDVQIVNVGATSEGDTEIRTQYLEFNPEQYIAETDARVQIRFGTRSVSATGMLASLNDDRIELKANVRGKIAP